MHRRFQSLIDKQSALAELKSGLDRTQKKLAATQCCIHTLHLECDWLPEYLNLRKDAELTVKLMFLRQ